MVRIAVFTDAHANLPAVRAVLTAIHAKGCDVIVHTGDALAIGPYPKETLDMLLNTPQLQGIMGNHEAYFVNGLPEPRPSWMSEGEVAHQHWIHRQLNAQHRERVAAWPYVIQRDFEGVRVGFMHYALDASGQDFAPVIQQPSAQDLDTLFEHWACDVIFYGHDHIAADLQGRARYVNPGSLGCYTEPVARYCIVEFQTGRYHLEHQRVTYDDAELYKTFEARAVPEREFIYKVFFGGRFREWRRERMKNGFWTNRPYALL